MCSYLVLCKTADKTPWLSTVSARLPKYLVAQVPTQSLIPASYYVGAAQSSDPTFPPCKRAQPSFLLSSSQLIVHV